jgi:YcxB-like protein
VHISFKREGDARSLRRTIRVASRKTFRRVWTMSVILLVLGFVVLGLESLGDSSFQFLGILLIALGVVYALLPLLLLRRQARRVAPLFAEPATFTLTDAAVTVENEHTTMILRWSGVSTVKEIGEFWILHNRVKMAVVIIPQECMTLADVAEFRAFLAGRNLAPAQYRIG